MNRITQKSAIELIDEYYSQFPYNNKSIAEKLSEAAKNKIISYDGDVFQNNDHQFILSKSTHVRLAHGSVSISPNAVKLISLASSTRYNRSSEINETKDGHTIQKNSLEINATEFEDVSDKFIPSQIENTKFGKMSRYFRDKELVCYTESTSTEHDSAENLIMLTSTRGLSDRLRYTDSDTDYDNQVKKHIDEEFSVMKDENGQWFTVYKDAISNIEKVFTGEQSFDPENLGKFINPDKKEKRSLKVKPKAPLRKQAVEDYFQKINEGKILENKNEAQKLSEMLAKHISNRNESIINHTPAPQFGN